jgi:hypothetical protein
LSVVTPRISAHTEVTEQRITMPGQQPIDAALGQLITQQQPRIIKAALPLRTPQRHEDDLPRNRSPTT